MRKMRKDFLPTLALLLLFSFGQVSYALAADQPMMALEEVERLIDSSPDKEVKAYFMSVERGTKLSTYQIILRGIYKEPGLKVIMFVMTGKIVAGMSGSPVYVGDKQVGALAYSFNSFAFSNYSWGGISPISLMMEEDKSGREHSGAVRVFNYEGMFFEPIAVGYELIHGLESVAGGKFMVTTSSAGLTTPTAQSSAALKAGMPIVVDLIEWTDEKGETTTISAMGTITYVSDDGKVFAFGHPFLDSRKVAYSFRTSEVMGTVYSQGRSFKLRGKTSAVLGAITFDGAYGIYGSTSLDELKKMHRFNLEFKKEGKPLHRFEIKVADSILTPLLAQAAFGMIGQTNGAPLPQEMSVTQLETEVELKGHKSLVWKELFASGSTKFGPSTIYMSSYGAAYEAFFAGVYDSLFNNQYDLEISNVSVSANFIPGRNRVLKLGAYKFPNKVVWGVDPILEILFVSQDNLMAIAQKMPVKIDWDKVEKPVYKKDTLGTDKDSEKIVWGTLRIDSAGLFFNSLSNSERQKIFPDYFLGAEDFLENFSRRLEATDQKIYLRVGLRPRSGLFDEAIAQAEDIMPEGVVDNTSSEWHVIEGGLTKRKNTVKNENIVIFYVDLPQVPNGYIVDQRMSENIAFEVVQEN